uniref:Uncharacterized protein n=1 Tax=Pyramimonas orientalis virus TaxID=455367 RepID=A0A7M3UP14_POV01|nr:hypothetical protein HWQ62_00331 [Pyramimonas orientalis virus]
MEDKVYYYKRDLDRALVLKKFHKSEAKKETCVLRRATRNYK